MIATLFADDVLTVTATPEMWDGELYPEEATCIASAVPARRREFTAGRLCARVALARLGIDGYPLRVGPAREPLWPSGIVGSISHGAGRCAVVACRSGRVVGLGLDIERDEALSADLVPMICTAAEVEWCANQRPGKPDWPKLIFSAKETVYKCLFPLTGMFLEFHDVAVMPDPRSGRFTANLLRTIPSMPGLDAVDGRFAWEDDVVMTGMALLGTARQSQSGPRVA